MTVTITAVTMDGSSIAGGDTIAFNLSEDDIFAGVFTTIRVDLLINGVDQGFIYNSGTTDPAYSVTDGALGNMSGLLSFSKNTPFSNGDALEVTVTGFADFDGANLTVDYSVAAPGPTVRLATVPRTIRSRQQ